MTPAELLAVLRDFHREKLAFRERHVAVARVVSSYSFNNTYQYIIAREDVQLGWLEAAIAELGGAPDSVETPQVAAGKKGEFAPLIEADAREAESFVARWRGRLESVTNARHLTMMNVILGEALEHERFFRQMLAGRDDLLGRRVDGAGTGNGVLPVRWIE